MQITNLKSMKGNYEDFVSNSSKKESKRKGRKKNKFHSVDRDLSKIESLMSQDSSQYHRYNENNKFEKSLKSPNEVV